MEAGAELDEKEGSLPYACASVQNVTSEMSMWRPEGGWMRRKGHLRIREVVP